MLLVSLCGGFCWLSRLLLCLVSFSSVFSLGLSFFVQCLSSLAIAPRRFVILFVFRLAFGAAVADASMWSRRNRIVLISVAHRVVSYHFILYHTVLFRMVSYRTIPYGFVSCCIGLYPFVWYRFVSHYIIIGFIIVLIQNTCSACLEKAV